MNNTKVKFLFSILFAISVFLANFLGQIFAQEKIKKEIVFVIDTSGSMSMDKKVEKDGKVVAYRNIFKRVKKWVAEKVKSVPEGDEVIIITFDTEASEPSFWIIDEDTRRIIIEDSLPRLEAKGMYTYTTAGLSKAMEKLKEIAKREKDIDHDQCIYVLTDGIPEYPPSVPEKERKTWGDIKDEYQELKEIIPKLGIYYIPVRPEITRAIERVIEETGIGNLVYTVDVEPPSLDFGVLTRQGAIRKIILHLPEDSYDKIESVKSLKISAKPEFDLKQGSVEIAPLKFSIPRAKVECNLKLTAKNVPSGVYSGKLLFKTPMEKIRLSRNSIDAKFVIPKPPQISFKVSPTQGRRPLKVTFVDESKHVTSREWDFGDRVKSKEIKVTHIYKSTGTFIVRLTLKGPGGERTAGDKIVVIPPIPWWVYLIIFLIILALGYVIFALVRGMTPGEQWNEIKERFFPRLEGELEFIKAPVEPIPDPISLTQLNTRFGKVGGPEGMFLEDVSEGVFLLRATRSRGKKQIVLEKLSGTVEINDIETTAGTLYNNDEITIGEYVLKFVCYRGWAEKEEVEIEE